MHIKSLKNGSNNNHNLYEIVNILGGIDKILTNYININISIYEEDGDGGGIINELILNNPSNNKSLILLNNEQIDKIYNLVNNNYILTATDSFDEEKN